METGVAVNTPEKTVLDGKSQIEDFYELIKMRQPHQLSKKEEKLIKDFESLIEGKDDADMLQGEAQNLFWKIKDAKELWYRKENISLMEGLGLIGYLESSYSGDKFDINAVEAKSKLTSLAASLGDEAASEYILTGDNLAYYEILKKAEIMLSENRKAAV
jgi:hypothetical protein